MQVDGKCFCRTSHVRITVSGPLGRCARVSCAKGLHYFALANSYSHHRVNRPRFWLRQHSPPTLEECRKARTFTGHATEVRVEGDTEICVAGVNEGTPANGTNLTNSLNFEPSEPALAPSSGV